MESLQDEIREIRKELRLAMNGVISTSMREKGIVYKLNFGVPYPEIKEIARKHKPNGELAAALWKEDIREFKILATFLQPAEKLPLEEAKRWVKEIPYLALMVASAIRERSSIILCPMTPKNSVKNLLYPLMPPRL